MSTGQRPRKWNDDTTGDAPCLVAARSVLKRRLRAVVRLVGLAAEQGLKHPEYVHQLRVSTRRSGTALRLFRGLWDEAAGRKLRRRLREVRAAASVARRDDVHRALLERDAAQAPAAMREPYAAVIEHTAAGRRDSQRRIIAVAGSKQRKSLQKLCRRLLDNLRLPEGSAPAAHNGNGRPHHEPPYTLAELALVQLPPLIDAVGESRTANLDDLNEVHRLRLAVKRLRYALEVFAGCFSSRYEQEIYPRIEELQQRLGDINDLYEILERLERIGREAPLSASDSGSTVGQERSAQAAAVRDARRQSGSPAHDDSGAARTPTVAAPPGMAALAAEYRRRLTAAHRAFVEWWATHAAGAFVGELHELVRTECGRHTAAGLMRPLPPGQETAARPAPAATRMRSLAHYRVAAIDVGTNSIRLVVAESDPQTKFRVIEDIKETTRLGSGLTFSKHLEMSAAKKSLRAIQRMKSVAEGFHVDRIRAVGTSALREAVNSREFIDLVRRRAGVQIEVIDAEHEARLAFSSVANTFNLYHSDVAVADIGGGSTELVFSSGGVIDAIVALPLGAVRLSEAYADPDGGELRFDQMRAEVDRVIHENVAAPPYAPAIVIGTGGTFTNLARLSILRGTASDTFGRLPFAVRGHELPRREVAALLEWLRGLSVDERCAVAGLSSQRAEIIVPGICIIERLMAHLGVDRLRVHDGGIRDGLLAEMIDELGLRAGRWPRCEHEAIDSVRRFAERSHYERDHSEHVTRLALQIFDQLAAVVPDAAASWGGPECRGLLNAAGILHDVGMLISWAAHHKHSYDMIIHADLPLFSRREIEIIANLARYHRRGGPKDGHPNFAKLGDDDQRLVRYLAGILRVADGLDRLHIQNVVGVTVRLESQGVRFDVLAEAEPSINIRYAARKADVFESAFHTRALFSWTPVAPPVDAART